MIWRKFLDHRIRIFFLEIWGSSPINICSKRISRFTIVKTTGKAGLSFRADSDRLPPDISEQNPCKYNMFISCLVTELNEIHFTPGEFHSRCSRPKNQFAAIACPIWGLYGNFTPGTPGLNQVGLIVKGIRLVTSASVNKQAICKTPTHRVLILI